MVRSLPRLRASARRHLLTLDGRSNPSILRSSNQITLSACTLYLVFKEPEARPDPTASLHRSAAVRASPRFPRFQPQGVVFGGTFQDYSPIQPMSSPIFTCGTLSRRLDWDRLGNLAYPEGGPPLSGVALLRGRRRNPCRHPHCACDNRPANLRII